MGGTGSGRGTLPILEVEAHAIPAHHRIHQINNRLSAC